SVISSTDGSTMILSTIDRPSCDHDVIDSNLVARRSAERQAVAWIVSVGLRPAVVGKVEPPRIMRVGTSCEKPQRVQTAESGSRPMRVPPKACVLGERGVGGNAHTSLAPAALSRSFSFCV